MNYNLKRHKLLRILSKGRDNFHIIKNRKSVFGVSFDEIYKKLNCDGDELHNISTELYTSKEIEYFDYDGVIGLFSTAEGLTSFSNKKYINVFWGNFFNTSKNIVQVFIPVFSLIIAYVALTTKTENLKKQYEKELQEVRLLLLKQQEHIKLLEYRVNKTPTNPEMNPKEKKI